MNEELGQRRIEFELNGQNTEIGCDDNAFLIDVLRDDLGLTGTKRSCDVEICGVCTVLIDGAAVSSCTTLAYEASGRRVVTIEGAGDNGDALSALQDSFVRHSALQCGFCTPGMVLTAQALLDRNPRPSRDEIIHEIDGNICRCTGYFKIIEAIESVSNDSRDVNPHSLGQDAKRSE